MKIGTLLGLAAVGGLYYAHRRRGGVLTAASVKDSFGALRENIGNALQKLTSMKSMEADADSKLSDDSWKPGGYDTARH